jgi:prephenate dehydrogenase
MGYEDPARAVQAGRLCRALHAGRAAAGPARPDRPSPDAGAIVTDVGSTKATVVRSAERLHPGVRFVGSHPMAGSEKRGVEHARADLYRGAVCITTPTDRTDPAALEQTEAFWRRLEMRVSGCRPRTTTG